MIKIKNLDQFRAQIDKFVEGAKQDAQDAAVGLAEVAFQKVLDESPQFSGDFVSAWQVSARGPVSYFTPWGGGSKKPGEYQKGDDEPINYALANTKGAFAALRSVPLGSSIFLSNSATHDEPYAWKIEEGKIKFRPENPNADRVVSRAVSNTGRQYPKINKANLAALRKVGV